MSKIHLGSVAKLARLHLSAEELALYESQVGAILGFVEQLNQVNVAGVEPTSHPLAIQNVFREDRVNPSPPIEEFLKHSPASYRTFFQVPKVIEEQ